MKLLFTLLAFAFCFVVVLAQNVEEKRYSTFNAVQLAEADAAALTVLKDPKIDPEYVRYLSLHNFPAEQRPLVKDIVDFVLNSLNTQYRDIVRTAGIPAHSPSPVALRVNLNDYGISPKAWDDLAEKGSGPTPIPDPYFHALLSQEVPLFSANWKAELSVDYQSAGAVPYSEIRVTTPGIKDLYIDNEVTATNGPTRTLYTPKIPAGNEFTYKIRVVGQYGGHAYDATTQIVCRAGRRVNVTMGTNGMQKKTERILAAAPWIALEPDPTHRGSTIAELIKITNTKNPILRADWFCVYATWAPAYYELIGLRLRDNPDTTAAKTKPKVFLERDFEKLLHVDERAAARDVVAAITDTRLVTLHNRVLHRFNTVTGITGGYYWRSKDTDTGIDDQDYLNQIVNFANPIFVAAEIISSGRNGLNFYFVADNKGVGLDLAAAAVAQHSDGMPCKYQDKQVWVSRNCQLCHANGMIPVRDKVRTIAQRNLALFVAQYTKDRDVSRQIHEAFSPTIQGIIDLDNAKFNASVKAACGKDGRTIAKEQESLIWTYWDQPVTLERMAWDSGIPPGKLKEMLQEGINLDYTLVTVLQDPEEPVALLTWERQGFAALMQYVIGYRPRR